MYKHVSTGAPIYSLMLLGLSPKEYDMRLHTENQLPRWPGSASKVCVGGWSTVNLVIALAIA